MKSSCDLPRRGKKGKNDKWHQQQQANRHTRTECNQISLVAYYIGIPFIKQTTSFCIHSSVCGGLRASCVRVVVLRVFMDELTKFMISLSPSSLFLSLVVNFPLLVFGFFLQHNHPPKLQ